MPDPRDEDGGAQKDADKQAQAAQAAQQPLRPAMVLGRRRSEVEGKCEAADATRGSGQKVVSIAEQPETITPTPPPQHLEPQPQKQFSAGVAKRLSGRPSSVHISSKVSLRSQTSFEDLPAAALARLTETTQHHQRGHHNHQRLLGQVSDWLNSQKAKSAARKERRSKKGKKNVARDVGTETDTTETTAQDSDSSAISLGDLEKIIKESMAVQDSGHHAHTPQLPRPGNRTPGQSPKLGPRRPSYGSRKRPSSRRMSKVASSDTEYYDGDVLVPSCDVVLDNSKTMSYAGGAAASSSDSLPAHGKRAEKEAKAWDIFKSEILRLAHTLRLKGWRRIPLENGPEIEVERLSGALTNAVYVVSPPKHMPAPEDGSKPRKPPAKLLLRIYGPQVEHLIDREAELSILRRLARKKIGPRLLGTFRNGRFEEYFASTTLTPKDMRKPDTSQQIAKRMRELHEGIELLEREREEGAAVWRNWDKWVERCETVVKHLDAKAGKEEGGRKKEKWMERGYVCGVEWATFRKTVERYREWLFEQYGGQDKLKDALVFAHNDTQYGNILRLLPPSTPSTKPSSSSAPSPSQSPLLLPQNSHKSLVVIDFEYASANTRGLEFANHFTEWCYDYTDSREPWRCRVDRYPTVEEQKRFVKAYLEHRPQYVASASASASGGATPKSRPSVGTGNVSEMLLDARNPGGAPNKEVAKTEGGKEKEEGEKGGVKTDYTAEENERCEKLEKEIENVLRETRLWRVANSAQWVAWGVVQANVPELDEKEKEDENSGDVSPGTVTPTGTQELPDGVEEDVPPAKKLEGLDNEVDDATASASAESGDKEGDAEGGEEEEEEFDYLSYAQDRAMFFWGDCVDMGIVKKEELPEKIGEGVQVLGY